MLTGKQRSYLKGIANSLPAILQVGKGGITDNLIRQVDEVLEARELIKGTVLRNSELEVRQICEEIAQKVRAEIVQVIGSRFVLYRESREDKVIQLP
jgi:RNA-binding protein